MTLPADQSAQLTADLVGPQPMVPKSYNITKPVFIPIGANISAYGVVVNCYGAGLWCNNAVPGKANLGLTIRGLTVLDKGGTGSLLRLTQVNDFLLEQVTLSGAKGASYSAGKVTVANGSTSVTGTGTLWTPNMAGILWINGYPQEVYSAPSETSLVLCSPYMGPSVTGSAYSLGYAGIGLHLEGTSVGGCCQYGTVRELKAFGNRIGVFCQGRPVGGAGVSCVRFSGGRVGGFDGARVDDSIAFWAGYRTDTILWDTPVNNVCIGAVVENGHQHSIVARFENDAPFCRVTTPLNISAPTMDPTKGVLVRATQGQLGYCNYVFPQSVYGFGDGVECDAVALAAGLKVDMSRSPAYAVANVNRSICVG